MIATKSSLVIQPKELNFGYKKGTTGLFYFNVVWTGDSDPFEIKRICVRGTERRHYFDRINPGSNTSGMFFQYRCSRNDMPNLPDIKLNVQSAIIQLVL